MDSHLKLNKKFYQQVDKIKSKATKYRSNLHRSKNHLQIARTISKEDILDRLNVLKDNPNPKEVLYLLRNLLNSGVWISRSSYKLLVSSINFTEEGDKQELSRDEYKILKAVANKESTEEFCDDEIFKVIFNQLVKLKSKKQTLINTLMI